MVGKNITGSFSFGKLSRSPVSLSTNFIRTLFPRRIALASSVIIQLAESVSATSSSPNVFASFHDTVAGPSTSGK